MMNEQMMNIVRERGGRRRDAALFSCMEGEHTYPVRLNQKRVEEERGGEEGWVGEGQKKTG